MSTVSASSSQRPERVQKRRSRPGRDDQPDADADDECACDR